jgi:2,3-bisphosphoglycerate-dependent phosphoglycerate mutase
MRHASRGNTPQLERLSRTRPGAVPYHLSMQPHPLPASPSTPSPPRRPPALAPSPTSLDRPFLTGQPGVVMLTFVRHGKQEVPSGSFTPALWADPPLSELGKRQAAAVGAALADESVDAVLCSHLLRAAETARAVAAPHGLAPVVYPELREVETYRDVPDGVRLEDVLPPVMWHGVQARFNRELRWDVSPFSESSAEFRHRVVTVVEGILALHQGRHLVIVCHGGVINRYIGHLLDLRQDMFFRPAHASVSRILTGDGRRVIHTLNELHHLQSVDPALVTF